MAIVVPKVRKHLSADALFRLVRHGFAHIPDSRRSETDIALADALMSAFAMFSLKAPSLLAFDKERVEGNLHTIYGVERFRVTRTCAKFLTQSPPRCCVQCSRASFGNCNVARRWNP